MLTVTANGVDTSPVIRGLWLVENLLGTPSLLRERTLGPEVAISLPVRCMPHALHLLRGSRVAILAACALLIPVATFAQETGTLTTLTVEQARDIAAESATALAKLPGELVLEGITDLAPEAAAALATHEGRLHLTGLRTLGESTCATLQAHANILLPQPLPAAQAAR